MKEFRILVGGKYSHFIVIVEKAPVGNGTVDLVNMGIAAIQR